MKQEIIKRTFNISQMPLHLQFLLSLEKNAQLVTDTIDRKEIIKFTGSKNKLQKEIYEWLKRRIK